MSLSSLVQFYGEGPNNDSLKHVFLLTTNALNKLTLNMSNYTLPVNGGLLPDSSSCPADCLTSLTAYMNEKEKTVVMLRPTDVVNFPGFSIMGIDAIYCTTNEGYCGANVPVYLYHSATDKDYYIGLASENRSNYAVQNSGKPHCFMWSNVKQEKQTKKVLQILAYCSRWRCLAWSRGAHCGESELCSLPGNVCQHRVRSCGHLLVIPATAVCDMISGRGV
ncbi:unnamed protein product [Haemonchus placei]|uniref:Uncharacterized protein n=1 Tax=Haemonchus placei TaxID=6290 RepID=A0A3P8CV52_HAEPC|nr:unnamed protein product [Haemonchus placei]